MYLFDLTHLRLANNYSFTIDSYVHLAAPSLCPNSCTKWCDWTFRYWAVCVCGFSIHCITWCVPINGAVNIQTGLEDVHQVSWPSLFFSMGNYILKYGQGLLLLWNKIVWSTQSLIMYGRFFSDAEHSLTSWNKCMQAWCAWLLRCSSGPSCDVI